MKCLYFYYKVKTKVTFIGKVYKKPVINFLAFEFWLDCKKTITKTSAAQESSPEIFCCRRGAANYYWSVKWKWHQSKSLTIKCSKFVVSSSVSFGELTRSFGQCEILVLTIFMFLWIPTTRFNLKNTRVILKVLL